MFVAATSPHSLSAPESLFPPPEPFRYGHLLAHHFSPRHHFTSWQGSLEKKKLHWLARELSLTRLLSQGFTPRQREWFLIKMKHLGSSYLTFLRVIYAHYIVSFPTHPKLDLGNIWNGNTIFKNLILKVYRTILCVKIVYTRKDKSHPTWSRRK